MKAGAIAVIQKLPGSELFLGIDCAKGRGITMPGGKLEPGELYSECAARELVEETGVSIDSRLLTHQYQGAISQCCPTETGFTYFIHVYHGFWSDCQGEPVDTPEGKPGWYTVKDFMENSFRTFYEPMFQDLGWL